MYNYQGNPTMTVHCPNNEEWNENVMKITWHQQENMTGAETGTLTK